MLLLSISQPSARLHLAPSPLCSPNAWRTKWRLPGYRGTPYSSISISFERVGGPFLGLLPSRRKALVTLAQLVHPRPTGVSDLDCGADDARLAKSLQEPLQTMSPAACLLSGHEAAARWLDDHPKWVLNKARCSLGNRRVANNGEILTDTSRARCDHHMKTGATIAAFARSVRLRPVDRRSTCPKASPIAPRTSSLAVQTQRRKLRRTRPERSAWPEPELTSSGSWQPREPMLPDDGDFGTAMARLTQRSASSWMVCGLNRLRRRVEPATTPLRLQRASPLR